MSSKKKPEQAEKNLTVGEALAEYLISLTPEIREKKQPEITKFVRWYGDSKLISQLTPQEVENYSNKLTATISELAEKIEPLKDFFNFAHKNGFTNTKLSPHLRVKRSPASKSSSSKRRETAVITLTPEGYAELESELKNLIEQRPAIREDIQKAAADKDFRENAPLAAAREQLGKLEGRILELETTLKTASILTNNQNSSHGAFLGDRVSLKDLTTGEMLRYTLVDIKEANPSSGKISVNSPIGKAIVGRKIGDKIQVNAPAGVLPFEITEITQN